MCSDHAPLSAPVLCLLLLGAGTGARPCPPGEGPALGPDRTTQEEIEGGRLSLREIRKAGLKVFGTNFNKLDGYGDGPMNPRNTRDPGGRPMLQNNGTLLRINGLDAQSCMECHSVGSSATAPFTFAVGGAGATGGSSTPPSSSAPGGSSWRGRR